MAEYEVNRSADANARALIDARQYRVRSRTKGRVAFAFGDFERLHRMGLVACDYRAAQWDHADICWPRNVAASGQVASLLQKLGLLTCGVSCSSWVHTDRSWVCR